MCPRLETLNDVGERAHRWWIHTSSSDSFGDGRVNFVDIDYLLRKSVDFHTLTMNDRLPSLDADAVLG